MCLFRQLFSVGIGRDVSAENHNALNKSPNAGDQRACATSAKCDDKLCNGFFVISEIKIMYAEIAEKDTQKSRDELGFCGGVGVYGRLYERCAAFYTKNGFGVCFRATDGAEIVSFRFRYTAFQADLCTGI